MGGKGIQNAFTKASNIRGIYLTPETLRQTHPMIKYKRGTINQQRVGTPRFGLLNGEYLTHEELNKLIRVYPKNHGELIYFIYHFGIPLKQFSNINFKDINFIQRIIKIKPNKICKEGIIKVNKDVFRKLKVYLEKKGITSGKIFKNDSSMYTKWIKKYRKIAGINKRLNHSIISMSKFSEERYNPI